MKLIIEIPEEIYELITNDKSELKGLAKAVKNGTPIPDNATNGDVIGEPSRRKGHWINPTTNTQFKNKEFFSNCSECGFVISIPTDEYNFCPNCGARMESEE